MYNLTGDRLREFKTGEVYMRMLRTLKYLRGNGNFGRRSAFGMEPNRDDPSASAPTNLERFLLFPTHYNSNGRHQ